MILSVSRRTDIPCRYSEWFMNRIRAGFALTRNPMNHAQLARIPITPDVVDCIVFWTKDAQPLLPRLAELDRMGYRYYFQFTVTPYGRELEPNLRGKAEIEDTLLELARRVGKTRVVWRYDPIILNGRLDMAFHKAQFARLCEKFAGFVDTVTVSFVDLYPRLKTPLLRPVREEEIAELSDFIGRTAKAHGLRAAACCEREDLSAYGIEKASCIDRARIEKICGCALRLGADKNQRPGCGCCESIDIGAYDTCPNGCVYCYATRSPAAARRRQAAHDPQSPLLTGTVAAGETAGDRKVKSNREAQTALF